MSLQDELLAAIRPNGIDLARLYFLFREHGQETVDYALQGLFVLGEISRSNNVALPRAKPLQQRCPQCHELRTLDRMMDSGICIQCTSDALIVIDQSLTKVCPCCRQEFTREHLGTRTYCVSCTRAKNARVAAIERQKYRARNKANGTKKGVATCNTLQRMTRTDSMLPGASFGASR